MLGLTRWNPYDSFFSFQREVDRLFNQFWSDLPARTGTAASPSFQVASDDEGWHIEVPLPGVDPKDVTLEAAGNTISIRAEAPSVGGKGRASRYEQTFTVPQFLDLDKVTASHRHGLLTLTLPLRDSVRPRRIQIESVQDDRKQLAGAAA